MSSRKNSTPTSNEDAKQVFRNFAWNIAGTLARTSAKTSGVSALSDAPKRTAGRPSRRGASSKK
jgi:hypothetical protein